MRRMPWHNDSQHAQACALGGPSRHFWLKMAVDSGPAGCVQAEALATEAISGLANEALEVRGQPLKLFQRGVRLWRTLSHPCRSRHDALALREPHSTTSTQWPTTPCCFTRGTKPQEDRFGAPC